MEYNKGEKLDIIGFDACKMACIEVLYQIKDYADYVVASEKDIPERGWPYYSMLGALREQPDISPEELAILVVDHYYDVYSSGEFSSRFSISLTAIKMAKIDEIIDNILFIETDRDEIESYEKPDYVDLHHYAQLNNLPELMTAINNSVIHYKYWVNSKGVNIEHGQGIAIYYPKHDYNSKYDKLKFAEDTGWDEGLKEALGR